MRTLLIVPSFLTVFVGAILALGLLISSSGTISPDARMMPSRDALISWKATMPARQEMANPSRAAAREWVDELEH